MKDKLLNIIRNNSSALYPVSTGIDKNIPEPAIIKSIIFDIYGTLIISASGDIGTLSGLSKSDIFLDSLKMANIKICTQNTAEIGLTYFYSNINESHILSKKNKIQSPEVIITKIWEQTLLQLVDEQLISTVVTDELIRTVATYFECHTNPVWPMPNLIKLIKILNEKKIILGIISNAQFYTPLIFEALTNLTLGNMGFNPELIQYSFIQKEAKPSLKMFNSISSKLTSVYKITPNRTLYVGNDMLNDIYSANKVGFKTALFAGDARSLRFRENDERVSDVNPNFLITDLMQIPELIK